MALAVGTYRNTFTNTVNLVVFNNDPDTCEQIINGLANGSFVVILENKYKGTSEETNPGDAAFSSFWLVPRPSGKRNNQRQVFGGY